MCCGFAEGRVSVVARLSASNNKGAQEIRARSYQYKKNYKKVKTLDPMFHTLYTIVIMVITYHGNQFVKIQQGDTLIVFNPPAGTNRFGATIGLVNLNDKDFNGVESLSYGDKQPLIISGPGEYEVKGIFIQGFGVPTIYKKEKKINTVYYLTLEGVRLCFLGALQKPALSKEIEENITEVDVLFVPIGGGDVLSPADAYTIGQSLEAKVIIPVQYEKDGAPNLKKFLEESGESVSAVDRLTVRKKDFEGKEGEVVVLKSV